MASVSPAWIGAEAWRAGSALKRAGLAGRRIEAPFPLWLVTVPDALDADLVACLDRAENARAHRFSTAFLSRRYLAAHGALRVLGEYYFGVPAARQRYVPNAFGKPCLHGIAGSVSGAQCSISYSRGAILVAWSADGDIGVDVETVRPIADAADLVTLHCTAAEQAALKAAGPLTDLGFLSVWVRKEACMKALGKGFACPPSSFDCGVGHGLGSGFGTCAVEIEGHHMDCGNYDLKGDLAVAWARLRLAG
ncbi:4'-phosphopantetheinyl transferase superfamily protein [Novosphingobium sp. BL-8H]|uniref:4'-phosphopantetheinyl transferase family protein n=1 Tax=Novosphingobium sp. BL-8H TaxID=3127640 RepID=UPI003757F491